MSGFSAIGGNFGMKLIDDMMSIDAIKQSEKKDEEIGDIFDMLFQAIDNSLNQTKENIENNTKKVEQATFGPPNGIKIEGFDYFEEDLKEKALAFT